ncbi:AraC family transcriptional regulator [Lentzea alba]|uniref:AraC family transcriptional regulator n=1 Tax=Lentzea alba TaxID=2714351 RepID=UPI0039BFD2E0
MDPFDELLRGVRADGAGLGRVEVDGARVAQGLTLYAVASGEIRVLDQVARAGDMVVTRGELAVKGRASAISGTYDVMGAKAQRLAQALPEVLVAPGSDECAAFYGAVDGGPQVVADRLLDWLMTCALKEWFDREHGAGWLAALGDEVVGAALKAMHAEPGKAWTLALLAEQAQVSRTTLATRFARLVGVAPLKYLTEWRMALAADLLAEGQTVAAVARRVGYADPFGFSAAFKRVRGISPGQYRIRGEVVSHTTLTTVT